MQLIGFSNTVVGDFVAITTGNGVLHLQTSTERFFFHLPL